MSKPWMRVENNKWLKEHANFTGEPDSIGWRCKETKVLILAEKTGRSIWVEDGPGPCAGDGEVRLVVEAYCPECGSKPEVRHGTPIREGDLVAI